MNKIYIGYVQGFHGLRGDLKIKNKFEYPEKVFKANNKIYLNDGEHTITYVKFYKGFYLVTIDNFKNINLVEKYVGDDVYFDKEDLTLDEGEYLSDDLIGLDVFCQDKLYGKVSDVLYNGVYKILSIKGDKTFMIPFVKDYVIDIDLANKRVLCKDIEGLIL